jgi:hypothetical protein
VRVRVCEEEGDGGGGFLLRLSLLEVYYYSDERGSGKRSIGRGLVDLGEKERKEGKMPRDSVLGSRLFMRLLLAWQSWIEDLLMVKVEVLEAGAEMEMGEGESGMRGVTAVIIIRV